MTSKEIYKSIVLFITQKLSMSLSEESALLMLINQLGAAKYAEGYDKGLEAVNERDVENS